VKLIEYTINTLCELFEKFYLFNDNDILYKIIVEKLADANANIRKRSFDTLTKILSMQDNSNHVLELKLALIKLISHIVYIKPHDKFDANILDLFIAHKIEFPDISEVNTKKIDLSDIKQGNKGSKYNSETHNEMKTRKQELLEKKKKRGN